MTGNAEVALEDLAAAQQHFQQAAEDPGLESIAYANMALVTFETGDNEAAIRAARQLLRRCRMRSGRPCAAAIQSVAVVSCGYTRLAKCCSSWRLQGYILPRHTLRLDR